MALLDRVATLLRANLNDLIDRAEDPEKMVKQVILDMENQLLQVKTQVAITLADQHLLAERARENGTAAQGFQRKAELAVAKERDDLARGALEHALASRELAETFAAQADEQATQANALKAALRELQQKLVDAKARSELLTARHRRARALAKATQASAGLGDSRAAAFDRLGRRVEHAEALAKAEAELAGEDLEARLEALDRSERVEKLPAELKHKRTA